MKLSIIDLLPKDEKEQQLLCERSQRLSRREATDNKNQQLVSYVHFKLNTNERYGIPYHYVKQVLHHVTPTHVPCTPDYIIGAINLRGSLLAVMDLKYFFHVKKNESPEASQSPFIIVIENNGLMLGILVDDILDSSSYDPVELDPPLPSEGVAKPEYMIGLHQGTTTMLHVTNIINDLKTNKI